MRRIRKRHCECKYLYLAAAVVLLTALCYTANAALSISALPTEGGSSLRFGRMDLLSAADKEVKLRITTNESTQYQIFQRIVEPLRNERGESISPSAVFTSVLPGSNSSGTLYLQNQERLGYSDQLIYTSASNGISDSLSLIYRIDQNRVTSSGNYFGKILYTLRPISGGAQSEVLLNVFFEAGQNFKVTTQGSWGADFVRLKTSGFDIQDGEFKISFKGNGNRNVRIYQEIIEFPVNEMNDEINAEAVVFKALSEKSGEVASEILKNFQRGQVLIYETDEDEDIFLINFSLDKKEWESQKAGLFNGKIQYIIQRENYEKVVDLNLQIEIDPIFKISLDYPSGGISFNNLIPNSEPQSKEVHVTVNTNLGKPYIINQNVIAPLTNEKGGQIPGDAFAIKQEFINRDLGKMQFSDFRSVPSGDSVLYYSDNFGSPVEFKVIYRLKPSWELESGNYRTSIVYSLGEI